MKIGFLGVQCDTANMGLAALTYASVLIARGVVSGEVEFVIFSVNSSVEVARMREELVLDNTVIRAAPFHHKRPLAMAGSVREMASCDLILDFTGGDSFSDIYGLKRLWRKLLHKQMVLLSGTPLVLAPQTYGPLRHRIARPWFVHVINRAARVFTRDDLSQDFLHGLGIDKATIATDVAVALPWDRGRFQLPDTERVRIGINISGLLWNGGYTGNNQFNLKADYRRYCNALVESLLQDGHEVHLIPHVLTRDWESSREDDFGVSVELRSAYPECVMAPRFKSPVEAKSYISTMNAFIGSRMHATIASFSAGVPTIPVAYSRKFQGLFGSLGYDVLVDLAAVHTADAVARTRFYLADLDVLSADVRRARGAADKQIDGFRGGLEATISSVFNNRSATR